jgi:N-acetylneuraminic acid mutarotase
MGKPYVLLTVVLGCALVLLGAGCRPEATTTTAATLASDTAVTVASETTTTTATTSTTVVSNAWIELGPVSQLPHARKASPMVYDPIQDRAILFGGTDGSGLDCIFEFNDTWVYDSLTNTWEDLAPIGAVPSTRGLHSMVYDPLANRVILFGGKHWTFGLGGGDWLNDTWTYDPVANAWIELKASGPVPAARQGHSMVYDPIGERVILFGGAHGERDSRERTWLNDTWTYDPGVNAWTELDPAGTLPPGRYSQAMAYDPGAGRIIMFGGYDGDEVLDDTWSYDLAANLWTEIKPVGAAPSARRFHSMVYDALGNRMILFGGHSSDPGPEGGTWLNDIWAYDPAVNVWTEIKPVGPLPSARGVQSMVYDPMGSRVILFGGAYSDPSTGQGVDLNDTWVYYPPAK